jgi:RNA polymerase sigma-70 factor (ECF subfamily)
MDDEKIVALYWKRDQKAIAETRTKYGRYCYTIAYNILCNDADAEECESDTYFAAWQSIPPAKPAALSVFLGSITRRLSLDRMRKRYADKRGGGEAVISLYELEECIPSGKSIDDAIEEKALSAAISAFLRKLPVSESSVFIRRYWYFDSVAEIAKRYGFGESKVKMMLKRTRDKLLIYLEKEGFFV